MRTLRIFPIICTISILCASCDTQEANRRGYVISQTHELTSEEPNVSFSSEEAP